MDALSEIDDEDSLRSGAWIETKDYAIYRDEATIRSAQERGLKRFLGQDCGCNSRIRSAQERGLKLKTGTCPNCGKQIRSAQERGLKLKQGTG